MDELEQKNIGVLIDADNTPCKKLRAILQEIAVHGHIITKRAYGDFSLGTLKNWKNELNDNAIIPVQQFAYTQGKNSSDSAMIIDAMDLLYTDKYRRNRKSPAENIVLTLGVRRKPKLRLSTRRRPAVRLNHFSRSNSSCT